MSNQSANTNRPKKIGEAEYRKGAAERIGEAYFLLRGARFAGSVYLAGRGVEGAMRAVIWKADTEIQQGKKSLDTGHDLHRLLKNIRNLGLLRAAGRDNALIIAVQHVSRLWYNDMRFVSSHAVESRWRRIGEVNQKRTIKQATTEFYDACSVIIKRCEVLCQKSKTP